MGNPAERMPVPEAPVEDMTEHAVEETEASAETIEALKDIGADVSELKPRESAETAQELEDLKRLSEKRRGEKAA